MTLHSHSIQALSEIKKRTRGRQHIVFVSGNFNIVHPGHLRLLRFAAECGDFLVVGVHDQHAAGALLAEELRLEGLQSISLVDYTFTLHDSPGDFIEQLCPAVVVKGKEHALKINPELEAVQSYGGKLLFSSGDVIFSSFDLLRNEFQQLNRSTIIAPQDFLLRHGLTVEDLTSTLMKMKKLKICVIGDTIVDEYITCDPLGMSQEDPTIVVTPIMSKKFIGGAAIVAAHAWGLGAAVDFFSVVGADETAKIVREHFSEYGARDHLYEDESRPTTLKQRFRANNKTLLRVNHLRNLDISKGIIERMLEDMKHALAGTDLLIFSDFNYGCLPQLLVDDLIAFCEGEGIMMVADSQSSSQVGDISRFKGMKLISPTEHESRIAVRDFNSGLVVLAEALRAQSQAENILMTLGAEGLLIHASISGDEKWLTDRLPTFNTAPKDTAGAGDSILTCVSMAMAVGCDIWQSAYLGSLAAACQIGRIGNIPLTHGDLQAEIDMINHG